MGIAGFEAVHVWLQSHMFWLGPVIFLVACLESLVAIGLLLPGVAMMFALGVLAGAGAMDVYAILAWGVLGAVIGDGLSFLIGRHYQDQLRGWWPFSRHPGWLERGEVFFQRYGALSVALGRFIGPVRPVIPAVAGMMGMPSRVFFSVNLVSSMGWSPVYLLPGYMTGAALQLHEQVPDRLVLVVLAWLSLTMGISGLWVLLERKKPVWSGWYPVLAGLLVMVLVTLNSTGHLLSVNHALNHWLAPLRRPWMEAVMAAVTCLGTMPVLGMLLLIFLGWQYRQGLLSGGGAFDLGGARHGGVGVGWQALYQQPQAEGNRWH
ncbi:MAG: DedA family protein [Endozoicomonas sp.]